MTGGTYVLVCSIEGSSPVAITFGGAGERSLAPASYAYVGSARGPGGFARIERHRGIAAGDRTTRHWHVDYLLGHDRVSIADVVRLPGNHGECEIAAALPGEAVPGIGASDCRCPTHLFQVAGANAVRAANEPGREP